ncbi:MAG: excinuclease ABC subunit UvrB [Actinobacteria bacterium]|nr:excinuclease ABC subunit UvrB [Actinomycetota bacterium]
MENFKLVSDYQPQGDQPKAINQLAEGLNKKIKYQTLLGVTGSGKTFTMAGVIEKFQKPTLVIAHNKTLAAQLCNEFKYFFPKNSVEYFVSYYDYYQPEAYIPQTDTYIAKDASINEEIDKLRHSATSALLSRRDVIIVASVSCIYNLGSPQEYLNRMISLKVGEEYERDAILKKLVEIQYDRNDMNFVRGKFRVRGDVLEVFPSYREEALRIEMFGDEVEKILIVNPLTGEIIDNLSQVAIYPATHFLVSDNRFEQALVSIEEEMDLRVKELESYGKITEAHRLKTRTRYDLELMREVGFCPGIENYSRHLTGKKAGDPPDTLLDYFPEDFLIIIDESHVTVPQVHGMYGGDRSRKETLIEHGFRLPSALDNRPLKFDEFEKRIPHAVFVSATPGDWELKVSSQIVEQIIRPTGLVDPEVIVRPVEGQIDDLMDEIKKRVDRDERVLVTTLTKKMAEDLTDYLFEMGIKARYLHSDIKTLERIEILRDLRLGVFDVLVGINLLREGLDLPEVSLVAILDADKEGFLRTERSLIQTIGRAARNVSGQVIMYAEKVTESMRQAINETNRRRKLQIEYNKKNKIEPQTIRKAITDIIQAAQAAESPGFYETRRRLKKKIIGMPKDEMIRLIQTLEEDMYKAADELNFEYAAKLRDDIADLKKELENIRKVKGER